METTTDRSTLEQKLIPELQRIAQEMGIEGTQRLRKSGLIDAIVNNGGNGARESSPPSSPPGSVVVDERTDDGASEDAGPSAPEPRSEAVPERSVEPPERDRNRDRSRGDRGHEGSDRSQGGGTQDRDRNQGGRNQDRNRHQSNQGGERNQGG